MERRLIIGGKQAAPGWEILDALPAPYVDHLGNAQDLSRFADDTFAAIYASHVLEHFDYKDDLPTTLKEWLRVLQPGGKLYASVPDLDTLARLLLMKDKYSVPDRYFFMRMLFGGHIDEYDYHYVGLNAEFLGSFLLEAGFTQVRRVRDLGFFNDSSRMVAGDTPISLNMIAEKPAP